MSHPKQDSETITATLRITVPSKMRDEVLKILRLLIGPVSVLPECVSCRLYQDAEDANILTLQQVWSSSTALERHIRSDHYMKILAAMELATEPPNVEFVTASGTAGIEFIEKIRNSGKTSFGNFHKNS